MSAKVIAPVASAERSEALDALRGACLLGVLLVNLLTQFRVSLFQQFLPSADGSRTDQLLMGALAVAVEWKAYVLFAFLFGVGLAAQRERALATGRSFAPYIARRLAMLLAIGLVHIFVVWDGDILALYAVAGFVVAPLLRLSTRALLALATAFFVLQMLPLPYPTPFPGLQAMRHHVEAA